MESIRGRVPKVGPIEMQDLTWGEYTPIAVGMNVAKLAKLESLNFAVAIEVPLFREKRKPQIEVGLICNQESKLCRKSQ